MSASSTPEHDGIKDLAWLAIVLYPVGLVLLNVMLLWRARGAIRRRDVSPTPLSRAIEFLHREYHPHIFWCAGAEACTRMTRIR